MVRLLSTQTEPLEPLPEAVVRKVSVACPVDPLPLDGRVVPRLRPLLVVTVVLERLPAQLVDALAIRLARQPQSFPEH